MDFNEISQSLIAVYYVQSREDEPILIKGYRINRGNTLSTEQNLSRIMGGFKFEPIRLNFGQSARLFSIGEEEPVAELEVFTNKGNYKFELDE